MSTKLTIQILAERLAEAASVDINTADRFIKEYFKYISDHLVAEHHATAEGIGNFQVDNGDVKFVPTEAMAAAINEPFSFFEPVRLNESVTESMLEDYDPEEVVSNPVDDQNGEPECQEQESYEYQEDTSSSTDETSVPPNDTERNLQLTEKIATIADVVNCDKPDDANDHYTYIRNYDQRQQNTTLWAVGCLLLGLILGATGGWFAGVNSRSVSDSTDRNIIPKIVTEYDTVAVVPEIATDTDTINASESAVISNIMCTDTVRAGYYITTMARKYYGNKNFWSYIYMENSDRLGHPEHTLPGTVVVIPSVEKYNIDADNPESVAAARKLAAEIYSRFQ